MCLCRHAALARRDGTLFREFQAEFSQSGLPAGGRSVGWLLALI